MKEMMIHKLNFPKIPNVGDADGGILYAGKIEVNHYYSKKHDSLITLLVRKEKPMKG